MISDKEIEVLLDKVIIKYARSQVNYFYLKNKVSDWVSNLDFQRVESLLSHLLNGEKVVHSNINYFFNQSNYIDFFNTLIDSDKKEEFRTYCLTRDSEIKKKVIHKLYIMLMQELKDDLNSMYIEKE